MFPFGFSNPFRAAITNTNGVTTAIFVLRSVAGFTLFSSQLGLAGVYTKFLARNYSPFMREKVRIQPQRFG
jgi:hypothetical protein